MKQVAKTLINVRKLESLKKQEKAFIKKIKALDESRQKCGTEISKIRKQISELKNKILS